MAITNGALAGQSGLVSTSKVESNFRISFDLDASYATGGYTSFAATIKAITGVGSRITIVDVQQTSMCGGYKLWYDRANDALEVWQYPNALGPATEVPAMTNLAAVTGCEMLVTFV